MKSTNLLIATAVAALTISMSCVGHAQVIYNQGVPMQRGTQIMGRPMVQSPQRSYPTQQPSYATQQPTYQTQQPTYFNVEMNDEQKAKTSLGASFGDARTGVTVRSVFTNGPAQKAGLSSGDVVVKANGALIESAAAFEAMVGSLKSGQTVKLTKLDDGKEKEVQCTLMTMGEVINVSTVPEAGPIDRAVQMGEQELSSLKQKISNATTELADMKKRAADQEKQIAELKVQAKDARVKTEQMKKEAEANRKKRMEALKKQAEEAAKAG